MAVRQAPTSVVQNVISALVEDPADLRRTAAAASIAAVLPGSDAADAGDALSASEAGQVAIQLDADELLKQAEEQAGDQVWQFPAILNEPVSACQLDNLCAYAVSRLVGQQRSE